MQKHKMLTQRGLLRIEAGHLVETTHAFCYCGWEVKHNRYPEDAAIAYSQHLENVKSAPVELLVFLRVQVPYADTYGDNMGAKWWIADALTRTNVGGRGVLKVQVLG